MSWPCSLPAIPVEEVAEPVLTIDEISKKLNVTTKTINRWRKRGLIGIPVVCNGRRQMGFLPSLVDPFLAANKDRLEKSSKFTLLTQEEKDDILRRAGRFARLGLGSAVRSQPPHRPPPGPIGRNGSLHDQEFRSRAPRASPVSRCDRPAWTRPTNNMIYNSYRRGMDVDTLAKNFQRNRSSMYRVLSEIRAQRLLDQPNEYIYHESFDDPALEAADHDRHAGRRGVRGSAPQAAHPEGRYRRN